MQKNIGGDSLKILVVGQTSSFWIQEYVVRALDPSVDEVYLLYDSHYGEGIKQEYEKKNVHLICTDRGVPILGRIPKIRTAINLFYHMSKLSKDKKFDVIEFQGMPTGKIMFFFEKAILKFTESVVCMYWGSDLLATPEERVRYAEGTLKKANYIVFDSNNLRDKFHEVFGNTYDHKIADTRLGTTIFEDLNAVLEKKTKAECKEYFGLSKNSKIVAIGYNGRKRQQHIEVLKELTQIKKEKMKDVTLLLHLGYGLESVEYRMEIENYLKDNFDNYKIIDQFLDKEQTAMLRYAVDIFIHAQPSDALAGSIKEYLYAGAILINPIWIDYSECKALGVKYWEYETWNELPNLLEKMLEVDSEEVQKNRDLLYKHFSWDAVKPEWDKIHGKM